MTVLAVSVAGWSFNDSADGSRLGAERIRPGHDESGIMTFAINPTQPDLVARVHQNGTLSTLNIRTGIVEHEWNDRRSFNARIDWDPPVANC